MVESKALLKKKASLQTSSARQDNHQLISPAAEREEESERERQRWLKDEGGVNKLEEILHLSVFLVCCLHQHIVIQEGRHPPYHHHHHHPYQTKTRKPWSVQLIFY